MKKLALATFLGLFPILWLSAQVVYDLSYDANTSTYTVSMQSGTAYTGGLARISNSTQITLVAPHTTGGFQITNLTDLQGGTVPLDWGMSRVDAPTENLVKDYIFFAPTNAASYTPFNIPANTSIPLFSFQSGSGCLGELALFNNTSDPLLTNVVLNPKNNFVVIGGGLSNQYVNNSNETASCSNAEITYCIIYDNNTQTYVVSMKSNEDYMGGLARISLATQISLVAPHVPGGFQITNLMDLQGGAVPLDWGMDRIDAPTENPTKDYLFFSPTNSITYTPFDIQKDSTIELFSFQSGSGCIGDIALFDNDLDTLNSNLTLNPDNSMVVVGEGADNIYSNNECPVAMCSSALKVRVLLQGALLGGTDTLMRDDLRKQNLIPLQQPYTDSINLSSLTHVIGGTEMTDSLQLIAKPDTSENIVDWVFIELRNAMDTTTIERTVAALVQRNGYVVDAATGGDLVISNLPDSFFLAVRHRNHLGVMTAQPVPLQDNRYCVDFTSIPHEAVYHTGAYAELEMATINGKQALWAGNALFDIRSKYDGLANDRQKIGAEVILHDDNLLGVLNFNLGIGYWYGDINLDGKVKYDGIGNDRIWLQNIILNYPMNASGGQLNNFNLMLEQLP